MAGFSDAFGGSTLQAAQVAYRAIAMSADLQTYWPTQTLGTNTPLPRIAEVTASAAGFNFMLPDATQNSPGQDVFINNVGSYSFIVTGFGGSNTIATVLPGERRYVFLTGNTTAPGIWSSILFGYGSSILDATAFAGYGLTTIGSLLSAAADVIVFTTNVTFGAYDRGSMFVNGGGSVVATLPNCTDPDMDGDYFFAIRNQGTGTVTLTPVGGQLINENVTVVLNANDSCLVYASATGWYTVGMGRNSLFNFTQLNKAVTGGTATLSYSEASNVVQTYTGVLLSNQIVVVPSAVQVYYISNQTSGAFSFTLQSPAPGTTLTLPNAQNAVVFCDGVNVINASTTTAGVASLLLGAGTLANPALGLAAVNNGLWAPTAATLAVSSAGVESVRWSGAQSLAPSGAVGLPSYSFSASATTGFYRSAADEISIATAGTKRLTVDANGIITTTKATGCVIGATYQSYNADIGLFVGGTVTGTSGATGSGVSAINTQMIATGQIGYNVSGVYSSGDFRKAASGVHPRFASMVASTIFISGGAATVTAGVTLEVDAAPTGAVTNYALRVGTGLSRLNGTFGIGRDPVTFFDVYGAAAEARIESSNSTGAKLGFRDSGSTGSFPYIRSATNSLDVYSNGVHRCQFDSLGMWMNPLTAIGAGGTTGVGFKMSSTSNFGVFYGTGTPSLTAAKGSLYLRTDGSSTTNRMYVNTDGGITWTAVTTAT